MQIVQEYISMNYMTLMMLAALIVIQTANRRTKIEGVQYVWAIIGLVFALTICEYMEVWCDTYHKPVWILYLKSALTYTIHPLLILLWLYLVAPVKHKLLLVLPFLAEETVILANLFGANLIFGYYPNHHFFPGDLHLLPALIISFYILVLVKYSLDFLQNKESSKAFIVIFIALSTLITVFLEYCNLIVKHTTDIAALEMLVYYFYLAAIQHSKLQQTLHESRLKLQQQEIELLKAQIQPHFINNSLMALRSRCRDYPEIYRSLTQFSKYLRSHFEAIGDTKMLSFEREMENVEAYLDLERENYGERLQVEYNIECDDFLVPALSVQPLVENAVRHGIGTYENGGTVYIKTFRQNETICIEIIDNGSGMSSMTAQQTKRKGIGIENVRSRLQELNIGDLEIIRSEHGTIARIIIKEQGGTE